MALEITNYMNVLIISSEMFNIIMLLLHTSSTTDCITSASTNLKGVHTLSMTKKFSSTSNASIAMSVTLEKAYEVIICQDVEL